MDKIQIISRIMSKLTKTKFENLQDGQMTSDGEDIGELTRESWEVC